MRFFRFILTKSVVCVLVSLSLVGFTSCRPRSKSSSALQDTVEPQFMGKGSFPIWAYDPGPDPTNEMGKSLIDLNSRIPYFPGLSKAIYGDQMFRPAFGPIPWRMMQKPNSVKILFIGQDGTHIAEAAGRPATAGFGGRAQDLAQYFGVGSSAAFINAFSFTIKWQYGSFDTPLISLKNGTPELSFASMTMNQSWLLSQDQDSPIVKWRNDLIEWIIRNNKDSLKLIVLFGGAARDAAASFVISKGGKVGSRFSEADLSNLKVPEYEMVGAGSNKQTAVPVTADGKDIYEAFSGRRPSYKDEAKVDQLHKDFAVAFKADPASWQNKMVFSNGGIGGSGVIHPAQIGGYNIAKKMEINGQQTISIKGLKISSDLTIDKDILVTQLPHPTALSMMTPTQASESVAKGLEAFDPYVRSGWTIEADPGFTNSFAKSPREPYKYRRGDMGPEYYDFGAPNSRMVNVSTASRLKTNVIVFGTRDRASFPDTKITAMTQAKPSSFPPTAEMWLTRPISTNNTLVPGSDNRRYTFDPGPGLELAKLMKSNLPRDEAFLKKYENNGDHAHYRGTFSSPKVVVLADPHGEDDLITSRALTGTRGQYLHGLMADLGVNEEYLVIRTAPFSHDKSKPADWQEIMDQTAVYREKLLKNIFEAGIPQLVLTDGEWAAKEFARIYPVSPAPLVEIQRPTEEPNSGISDAVVKIKQVTGFSSANASGKMLDIPRSHLPYYSRVWEGTSGDRVITSSDTRYRGVAFAMIAPQWAYTQSYKVGSSEVQGCEKLFGKLAQSNLRLGGEKVSDFLARKTRGVVPTSTCADLGASTVVSAPVDDDGDGAPAEP